MIYTGVQSYADIRGSGARRRDIEDALAAGTIVRVQRGWYAGRDADQRVVRGLVDGCRLGCLTGCAVHGVWTPRDDRIHAVYGRGNQPVEREEYVLHADPGPRPRTPLWPLRDCLRQVARHHDMETTLIVVESALHKGLISPDEVEDIVAALPVGRRGFAGQLRRAESGTETRVRYFLKRRGVRVRSQVVVSGVGRVDLLVGQSLIVECDSDEFHRSREQQFLDRERDLSARLLGYDTLRLSYDHVWWRWEQTQERLLWQIRRRHHGRRP